MLRSIWEFRGFIASLVLRDFRTRAARAVWGHAWIAIQPALQIAIYVLIFSEVLRAKLPGTPDALSYALYVCVGLLTWNFFADLMMSGRTLFLEHADLLRSLRFPRSTLPTALLLTTSLNAAIPLLIFLAWIALVGRWPGSVLLGALPFLAVQTMLGLSLAVLFATLNVFFRDVGHIVPILLQFWFWLTPIVYPVEIVPSTFRVFFDWNPMFHVVTAYQRVVVSGAAPEFGALVPLAALATTLAVASWGVFRVLGPDLIDEL